jgi:hypothetical protein
MMVYLRLGICFLPLVLGVVVCRLGVRGLRWRGVLLAVLLGLLAFLPITVLQVVTGGLAFVQSRRLVSVLLTALLFNGLIEEAIKLAAVAMMPARGKPLGVFAAEGALLGLSLGCFETAVYFVTGHGSIVLRMATAVLIHTEGALLSSVTVWLWKQGRRAPGAFVSAVLIHGVYNFVAGLPQPLWYFSLAAILLGALQCRIRLRGEWGG